MQVEARWGSAKRQGEERGINQFAKASKPANQTVSILW